MLKLSLADGTEVPLERERLSIGRDAKNDLVLNDGRVSGFHCAIIREGEHFEIVDLGSVNGTFVDEAAIHGRHQIRAWAKIRVGETLLEVVDSENRRPTMVVANLSSTSSAFLELSSGGNYPASVKLNADLSIGRNSDNLLRLDLPTISGNHARIVEQGGAYILEDQGSTNGTYINGSQIKRQQLKDGDRIRVDSIEYVFHLPSSGLNRTQLVAQESGQNTVMATQFMETPTQLHKIQNEVVIKSAQELVKETERTPKRESRKNSSLSSPAAGWRIDFVWLCFSFTGRLPRLPYFFSLLGLIVVAVVLYFVLSLFFAPGIIHPYSREARLLSVVQYVVLAWPALALNVKRIQDMGLSWHIPFVFMLLGSVVSFFDMRSGFGTYFLIFYGLASLIFSGFLIFRKGDEGPNRYGMPYHK
jgi:pSer/pThr/pTyr-binding forkhead associated (FHA) protein/uncharacterized membrane protein YhaH (DUF805 family)